MGMFRRFGDWAKKHWERILSAVLGAAVIPFIQDNFKEVFKHWIYGKIADYAEDRLSHWGTLMLAEFGSYIPSVIAAVITGILIYIIIKRILEPLVARRIHTKDTSLRESNQAPYPALRADELRNQRETRPQRGIGPSNSAASESTLPPNAKFRFRGEIFWYAARQYTPDEARDMRDLIREIYNCVMGRGATLVYNYNGPLIMFTRNWRTIILTDGPSVAFDQLNGFRDEVIGVYQTVQTILSSKPFYRQDLTQIIAEGSVVGDVNGALNNYMAALRTLPPKPSVELTKMLIGPLETRLEEETKKYQSWINGCGSRIDHLRPELEKLSSIEGS